MDDEARTLILTTAQCREVDRIAIDEWSIPGIVLMENAGRGAAGAIADLLQRELNLPLNNARVAIYCGSGNNGGDGYVIGRHLANRGVIVRAWASKPPSDNAPDAAVNHAIALKMQLVSATPLLPDGFDETTKFAPDIVLDALLGTGFKGPPRTPLPRLIEWCIQWRADDSRRRVIAIDTPSGMDCDTGGGLCVTADLTLTFAALKIGFAQNGAAAKTGRVQLIDIGAPLAVIQRAAATSPK